MKRKDRYNQVSGENSVKNELRDCAGLSCGGGQERFPFKGLRNCRLGTAVGRRNTTKRSEKRLPQPPCGRPSSSHVSLFPPSLSVSSKKRTVRDSSIGDAIVRRFFVHTGLNAAGYPSLLPFDSNASPANPPLGNLKAPPSVLSISPWPIGVLTKLLIISHGHVYQ